MKISTNIEKAKTDYPQMFHVVSSNEVHSFETKEEAEEDLEEAQEAEAKIKSGFEPQIFSPATIYTVNQIRSRRAVEREKLDPRTIETHIGDYSSYEEAKAVYDSTATGTEVDKELVCGGEVIYTTF